MLKMRKFGAGLALGLVALVPLAGAVLPAAHAQTVPTLSTSDIAQANGPVWTAVVDIIKYYISTYGVLMMWIFGIVAVFVLAVLVGKKFLHF